jgi:RHS repeat-associated protein
LNEGTGVTTVTNHRRYDSFGKLISETNTAVDLIFGFTGKQFDEATGLQHNLFRWYDSAIGQWVSEDPLSFKAGDENIRRYVGNSIVMYSDPSGLDWGDFFDFAAWKRWAHSSGNQVFPGSATNNSEDPVLVWSDLTGYYYLQPGETSGSGDCVDFIYEDVQDDWYKVAGVRNGHVDIGTDGIPEEPQNTLANPLTGTPVYFPDGYPGNDLDPVPPGGWVPTSTYPFPVPFVCNVRDWL